MLHERVRIPVRTPRAHSLLGAALALALLLPGIAAAQDLTVTLMPLPPIVADGQARGINFVVAQSNGMLATDAQITYSHVDRGTLAGCQAAGGGILTCSYTPPVAAEAGQAVLVIDLASGGSTVTKRFTIPFEAGSVAAPAPAPAPVVVAPAPAPVAPAPAPVAPAPTTDVKPSPADTVATPPTPPAPAQPEPWTAPAPAPVVAPPVPVTPPPPSPGFLTLNSKPWATVYLDGVIVGNTPINQAPIDAGEHTLVLRCGTCAEPQERRYQFTVASGETYTNISTDFTQVAVAAVPPATTVAPAPTMQPGATAVTTTPATSTATVKFPFTEQPYRFGRLFVRYPIVGYQYSQAAGTCMGDRPCPHFVNLDVTGPDDTGMVMAPAAFGVYGEIFPIEFIGVEAGFETVGYKTDHTVINEDGSEGNFGDQINRVHVGARARLPLLNNRPAGPLDIIIDVGYAGQDFLYFETTPDQNAWTFSNLWANGFRFGFGARFQAHPAVIPHADWHGTIVGSGFVSHEVEAGVQIRLYKMISMDLSWILNSRSVTIAKQYAQEETAGVTDMTTGGALSVGAVF